jgi:hypothetical protein
MTAKTYMKASNFGQVLTAFADLLAEADAVEQASAWRAIVLVFQAKPSKSVNDVCSALADVAGQSLRGETIALFAVIGAHFFLDDLSVTTATSVRLHTSSPVFIILDIFCMIVGADGVCSFHVPMLARGNHVARSVCNRGNQSPRTAQLSHLYPANHPKSAT